MRTGKRKFENTDLTTMDISALSSFITINSAVQSADFATQEDYEQHFELVYNAREILQGLIASKRFEAAKAAHLKQQEADALREAQQKVAELEEKESRQFNINVIEKAKLEAYDLAGEVFKFNKSTPLQERLDLIDGLETLAKVDGNDSALQTYIAAMKQDIEKARVEREEKAALANAASGVEKAKLRKQQNADYSTQSLVARKALISHIENRINDLKALEIEECKQANKPIVTTPRTTLHLPIANLHELEKYLQKLNSEFYVKKGLVELGDSKGAHFSSEEVVANKKAQKGNGLEHRLFPAVRVVGKTAADFFLDGTEPTYSKINGVKRV